MKLAKEINGKKLTVSVSGMLNAISSSELEAELRDSLADVDDLVLDLSGMEYISSAGLRVLLGAQQYMDEKDGTMIVRGVNDMVMETFEETGFDKLLDIE